MATANALFDYIRDLEANGIDGATFQVVDLYDDTIIVSGSTVIDGIPNTPLEGSLAVDDVTLGYPGPIKYRVTDPLSGITREHTSKSIGIVGPIRLIDLPFAFAMMSDGVVEGFQGGLAVTGPGTAPLRVSVASGEAFGHGLIYRWPVARTVPLDPVALSGGHRVDQIVLRYYLPGNEQEGKIELRVLKGTEYTTTAPALPALTRDDVTLMLWEVKLAEVTLDAGVSFIAPAKVADKRTYTYGPRLDSRYMRLDAATSNTGGVTINGHAGGGILNVRDEAGTIRFYVEDGTPAVQIRNHTDFKMFTDNGGTLLFRIDGDNGQQDFGGIGKPTASIHGALSSGGGSSVSFPWGNDNVFSIHIHTGATATAGDWMNLIFNKNRQTPYYHVDFAPENSRACDLSLYTSGKTVDHFTVNARQAPEHGVDYWFTAKITGAFV